MEKQIKEMTDVLSDYTKKHGIMASVVILENYAEILYNEGYRKQVWHDVSDPPKTSGLYIVCTDKGSVFTAHYYADCGRFNAPFKKSVVRWTEMPEAPREE